MSRKTRPIEKRKLVAYYRVSTRGQAEDGLSLDVQREQIHQYAALRKAEIVAEYQDAGRSAGRLDRPGLDAALKTLEEGQANGLICLKLDRLTRSVADLGHLLKNYFGPNSPYDLIVVLDQIDTETANGRLTANVLMSVAQWEREITAERTRIVREDKRAKGEYLGGAVPFGYRVEKRNGVRVLAPDEDERATMKMAADLRSGGLSYEKIASILEAKGVMIRGKKPTRQTVWRMLR